MLRAWWEHVRIWWKSPITSLVLAADMEKKLDEIVDLVRDDERAACMRQLEHLAATYPSESDELLGVRRAIALLHQPDELPTSQQAA